MLSGAFRRPRRTRNTALSASLSGRKTQYLRVSAWLANLPSSGLRIRARLSMAGPFSLPIIVLGATVTRELLRIHFALPVFAPVKTTSLPSLSANQTGVPTASPFLRNVVSTM